MLPVFYNDNPTFSIVIGMNKCISNCLAQCIMHINPVYTHAISPIHKRNCHIIIDSGCHFIEKIK